MDQKIQSQILLISTHLKHIKTIKKALPAHSISITSATETAIDLLSDQNIDVIISSVENGKNDEAALFTKIMELNDTIPMVVITEPKDRHLSLKLLASGAFSHIDGEHLKDILPVIIKKALAHRKLQQTNSRLSQQLRSKTQELIQSQNQVNSYRDRLVQTSKLATISTMIAMISHDINNQLHLIQGFARRILKGISNHKDDQRLTKIKEYATYISDSGQKIQDTVNQYRALISQVGQNFHTIDIRHSISDAIATVADGFLDHGITIHFHQPQIPVYINGDPILIQQLMINILVNGKEAIASRQQMKTGVIDVSLSLVNEKARLTITDNGDGISQNDREKIFKIFYSTKKDRENLGIGLAICRRIVSSHMGKIEISDQTKNSGTVLDIELPLINRDNEAD